MAVERQIPVQLEEPVLAERETIYDDALGARIDPETGEILEWADAPAMPDDTVPSELIAVLGERLARLRARLAGLKAERDAWLERVATQYDARINAVQRALDHAPEPYLDTLRGYAAQQLVGKKSKSHKEGLLTMSFRSSRERLDVTDEEKAMAYLEQAAPEAIVVRRTIAKQLVPAEVRAVLAAVEPDVTGLDYHPAGEREEFEVR